ncbi:MAG: Gfo/Idh/MocA family protein [Dermatophilaceae bacterium]
MPRPVRVAVVGGGLFGREHIGTYRSLEDVELVAVVEPSWERRTELLADQALLGTAQMFASVHDMLVAVAVDAASVVVPSSLHQDVASELMLAGIDVLVEKPFAEAVEDAREIAKQAAACGRICLPGHVLRFSAPHRELRDRLRAGVLGEVIAVALRRDRSSALMLSHPGEHPASLTGVHDVDLAIWLTGQRVVEVCALEHCVPNGKNVDLVWAQLRHVDGAISSVHGAYLLPVDAPDMTSDQIDVYGTAGSESLHDAIPRRLTTETCTAQPARQNEPLRNELSHFVSCVAAGQPSAICTPDDAVHVVEVVRALIESAAAHGVPVVI